jgi:hypothetical protein
MDLWTNSRLRIPRRPLDGLPSTLDAHEEAIRNFLSLVALEIDRVAFSSSSMGSCWGEKCFRVRRARAKAPRRRKSSDLHIGGDFVVTARS